MDNEPDYEEDWYKDLPSKDLEAWIKHLQKLSDLYGESTNYEARKEKEKIDESIRKAEDILNKRK